MFVIGAQEVDQSQSVQYHRVPRAMLRWCRRRPHAVRWPIHSMQAPMSAGTIHVIKGAGDVSE